MRSLLYIIFTLFLLTACSSEEEEYNPVRGMWETPWDTPEASYEVHTKDFKYYTCDKYGIPLYDKDPISYTIKEGYIYYGDDIEGVLFEIKKNPKDIGKGTYMYRYFTGGMIISKKRE